MKPPVTQDSNRRPAAFSLDEPAGTSGPTHEARERKPRQFDQPVMITPDEDDPFLGDQAHDQALPVAEPRKKKGFSFANLAAAAFGTFLSLAFGLWADQVIRDLFTRADWLGYTALTVLAIGIIAVLVIVAREIAGLMRLSAAQDLKDQAQQAMTSPRPAPARQVVERLAKLLSHQPETTKGRAALAQTHDEIIDSAQLLDLAERELLSPLDRRARALILSSAKRVSIVTAVSPRAIVDLAYVLYEVSRLIRAMADLYGGRPGTLGLIKLMRDVIAHLAVTGSIAVGDSLAQQVLGHGLASRLSSRLGEGVINGLLTARIGIAAMDLCRPLPFNALKRPGIGDFIGDIASTATSKD